MARCDLETLEVRAVFDDGALADLLPDEKNRAKELIEDFMIAANGVTARYLDAEGPAVAAPRAAHAEALGPDRRAGGRVGRAVAADPGRRGAGRFPDPSAAQVDPVRFPDLSLVRRQAAGLGRVRARSARPAVRRAFRTGGEGLHAFHGAEPPLSRPRRAAPAEGGARRAAVALHQRRARDAGAPLHRRRKTMRPKWNGRCASPPRRCCWPRGSARGSMPS